ncbi:hypothetical protein F5Y04DRAFT_184725 [Hypomontagnella monticulosa]|nr:hypothetical protein F5Y04DRAFT_184725 [Hypomontagnella monticulosa]
MSAPSTSAHPPPPVSSAPEAPGAVPSAAPKNATGSSNTASSLNVPPSIQSTSSRPQPSNSASVSRTATSPPTTTIATTSAAGGAQARNTMDLNPTLPSRTTQLHITEARAALVASMSNMLDSELQSRASLLHSNAAALSKQERDVAKGTEALRRENDKLEKLARDTERKIKELGNVQNWAEVLERDFLVLEETMRLVKEGSGSDDESCSQCSRSTWSGSYSADDSRAGSRRGSVTGDVDNAKTEDRGLNGYATMDGGNNGGILKGEETRVTVDKAVADSISEAMATSLHEPLDSLSLSTAPAEAQEGSVKGKEPATEDSSTEVDSTPESRPHELFQQLDISRPESLIEEPSAAPVDKSINPSTTTGL